MKPQSSGRAVAPGSPTFELHTLGWRAFQDLCAAVLRQVWGQSVQAFADSNDAGRDGAFYGVWHDPANPTGVQDLPPGPFVLQCKHTKSPDSTLSSSALADEFDKVSALVDRGLCGSYILLTNARITGNAEATIRDRLRGAGVNHPLILGGQWLCDIIAANRTLRLFVPRVYGLGDLSQILDERAYAQASVLMSSARDQVATFVVTEPYRKAAQALQDHGFVLLLGEPAVGKSVIALMLALAAADNWGCMTIKARTANELVAHWNPHEPEQFFWVDDAFGAVRHEEQLTYDWSRSLSHVMAAIGQGARIVLTSRSYIYEDARCMLKEYAYPRLREQQVTVDVEDLSLDERRQILYNHLAYGDQPVEVRRQMKPFLDRAAAAKPFRPEVARRLGQRAFTTGLSLTRHGIEEFMTSPRQFLRDVYDQLGANEQAALALVYAAANKGSLESPLALNDSQRELITRAGGTPAGTAKALQSLSGTFLRATSGSFTKPGWTFRHPTLWEGFAAWVSVQPHLLTVVLTGLSDEALLTRVDCEIETADEKHGVLLRVPPALYRDVAERLAAIGQRPIQRLLQSWDSYRATQRIFLNFLARRSSDEFLRTYLDVDPDLVERLLAFTSYVEAVIEPDVLARLHQAHLLSEPSRLRAVEHMADLAISTPDSGWLSCKAWSFLLAPNERTQLMDIVRAELVPMLETAVEGWLSDTYEEDDPVENALFAYSRAFESEGDTETAAAFDNARALYSELMPGPSKNFYDDGDTSTPRKRGSLAPPPEPDRSIFDDIDY